ncbi:hypothetical protein F4861DRAFT_75212 [Xylaria intraflava]|nr:hypothetical protein F4861DRAFT_75212 [Xylaria intraflava]
MCRVVWCFVCSLPALLPPPPLGEIGTVLVCSKTRLSFGKQLRPPFAPCPDSPGALGMKLDYIKKEEEWNGMEMEKRIGVVDRNGNRVPCCLVPRKSELGIFRILTPVPGLLFEMKNVIVVAWNRCIA